MVIVPLPRRQAPYSGNACIYPPIMIESYFPRGCGLHRFLMKYHVFGFPLAVWAFWPKHFDFIQNIPESSFLHTFYIGDLVSTFWFFSAFQFFLIFFEYPQQKYSRIFIFTYVLYRGLDRHILIFSTFSVRSHLFWKFATEIFQNLHFYIRFI